MKRPASDFMRMSSYLNFFCAKAVADPWKQGQCYDLNSMRYFLTESKNLLRINAS